MTYDLPRSGILAFMCGFVDTIVFVHMGGLFVARVTGNFVLLEATIAGTSTTVMTGNTTQAAVSLARRVRPATGRDRSGDPLRMPMVLVAAFLVGSVLGALSAGWIGRGAVALPGAMLIAILASRPSAGKKEGTA